VVTLGSCPPAHGAETLPRLLDLWGGKKPAAHASKSRGARIITLYVARSLCSQPASYQGKTGRKACILARIVIDFHCPGASRTPAPWLMNPRGSEAHRKSAPGGFLIYGSFQEPNLTPERKKIPPCTVFGAARKDPFFASNPAGAHASIASNLRSQHGWC